MIKNLYYYLFAFTLFLSWSIQGNAQDVPELMYYKFDASMGNQTPNEANPVSRLGSANGTLTGSLTIGGAGQFISGLQGSGLTSTSNYLNSGWTGSYTGSWTISMYLDVTEIGSNGTQYFFGSSSSSTFRCFTGGVAYDDLLLRGSGLQDVTIPDLLSGPVVATFAYDANTNTIKGYKNGVLVTTISNWNSNPTFTLQGSDFHIAGYSSNNGLNGVMDEFRFYNRALDDAEVTATWDQTLPLTDCAGQPSLGAITGPTDICGGTPFSLGATGINAAGVTYQWQESSPGTNNWTNIPGAIASSLAFPTGLNTSTDYRVIATCTTSNLSDTSAAHNVDILPASACFCTPTYTSTSDYLSNISITTDIDNHTYSVSARPAGGYDDQSNINIMTYAGDDIDIATTYVGGSNTVRIWVDWNDNGVFEANELMGENYVTTANQTFNFVVPAGAQAGNYRIRVRSAYSTAVFDACNSTTYGSAVDFTLTLISLANCSAANAGTISSNQTQVCADESFILSTTGASSPGTGLTYQWQSSPAGQNTWTDIAGANSLGYTGTGVNGDTDFRLKVNCSFGNLEHISNTITVNQTPATQCYCTPPPPSISGLYWIDGVITTGGLNNINNTGTGASPNGYMDYSGTHSVSTFAGGDFDLEIQSQNGATAGVKVWIDWNKNGTFEASELVYSSTAGSSSTLNIYNTNIQVPANVTPGPTKMRIRNYTGQEPCNLVSYGEAEDYEVLFISLANCSSADAGTISSNQTNVCADESFTLTTTGATSPGTGLTYQWQSSPAGANTWTDIAGATSLSYTGTGVTGNTDFRLKVNCSFGNLESISNIVSVDETPANQCYCTPPPPTYNTLYWIENVTTTGALINISNLSTGFTTGGYADYTGTHIVSTFPAGSFTLDIQAQSGGSPGLKVWIDWNQNGVFEASELVYSSTAGSSSTLNSYSTIINVPTTAATGNTRMRIRNYTGQEPCNQVLYGEAEDYNVQIAIPTPCAGTPTAGAVNGPADICPSTSFTVSTVGIAQSGITYQWQSSPAGANTWTDIAGADQTTHTVTAGIVADTDYRVVVTCTNSNQSVNSSIHSVSVSPATDCYCVPVYNYGCNIGARVNGVTTTMAATNINNVNTGCNELDAMGYTDYSATHEVEAAQALPVGISVNVSNYSGGVKVWVDWNQNGIFEANELVTESASTVAAGGTHTGTFTVPSNAALGFTKMRVRVVESSTSFDPCSVASYGEAEDYGFVVLQGVACAGTPTAGNINGLSTVCPTNAFDLDVDPVLEAGIEYQWQSSPAGANTWSNITGGTGIVQSFPAGINVDTDYRVIITCTNSNQSDTTSAHSVTINPPNDCYCIPVYTIGCSSGDDLSNVTLAGETVTLNNSSGCSPTSYTDYRGTVDEPDLLAGETYSLSASTSYGSPTSENVRAWIDWNQNGTFEASEEIMYTNGGGMPGGTYTENFTVPAGTPNGQYTMRVRVVWGSSAIDPCASVSYGEAEDYYVIVGALCDDPIVDLGPDVTICAGSSVTLDAGNPGLEYEWSNNATTQTITVTQAGTYSVTVFDGDCSTTESITVTVQDLPIVDLGNDKTICDGDVITLDAGNAGANYLWSDNSTGQTLDVNQAGTYHVTVTEGTCSASDTVNVGYYPTPNAGGIIVTEQGECTFTFSVDNPQNVNYFEWNFGDGSIPTIGALATHTYTTEGQFTVTLTLKNECDDEVILTYVVFCEDIGIEDLDAGKNAITLYPNPTTERITIESNNNAVMESITVYNVLGQVVYENATVNATEHIVDVAQLASGVYTVRIQTNQGYTTRKFEIIK